MSDDEEEFHPLKIAEMMKKDLAVLENYENRQEITQYLKDQFVAQRLEASSKQEVLREAALNALIRQIEDGNLPTMQLLRILEITNKGGEIDLSSVLGGGGKGGVNLQINNNPQAVTAEQAVVTSDTASSPTNVKDLGFMLEAMKTISNEIPIDKAKEMKDVIDVEPDKKK